MLLGWRVHSYIRLHRRMHIRSSTRCERCDTIALNNFFQER